LLRNTLYHTKINLLFNRFTLNEQGRLIDLFFGYTFSATERVIQVIHLPELGNCQIGKALGNCQIGKALHSFFISIILRGIRV